MLRFGKSRRTFSIGLAIWFVWLTVSVHSLHSHPEARCNTDRTELIRNCAPSDYPSLDPLHLADIPQQEHPVTQMAGLCPICVFLAKHLADRPDVLLSPALRDHKSERAIRGRYILVTSLDRPTTSPRAPPCQLL
jgi:hypothetical protein